MNQEEKLEKLKYLFAISGKKFPGDAEAGKLIARIDRLGLIATIITHGIGVAIYFTAGALAGLLLGLNPLAAGGAFLLVRLALNYSPTNEEINAKVNNEKRIISQAILDAPTDPAILAELLGQAQYNSENAPKA